MNKQPSILPTLLYFILGGALIGSAIGFIIISSGTGHVPWLAVFAVPFLIGTILGAIFGAVYLSTQKE